MKLNRKTLESHIELVNLEADRVLAERRARAGPHRHGWHHGKPNPYTATGIKQKPRFSDY